MNILKPVTLTLSYTFVAAVLVLILFGIPVPSHAVACAYDDQLCQINNNLEQQNTRAAMDHVREMSRRQEAADAELNYRINNAYSDRSYYERHSYRPYYNEGYLGEDE